MNTHSHEEVQKQVRIYIRVFLALAILTALTVGVSYLKLPLTGAIVLALFIATVKSSLVAAFFMHLVSEKKIILGILVLAISLFVVLLLSPAWHSY
jgi:cytochrome c oxidase subunit 4